MTKTVASILDIGSSKITLISGTEGINDTFIIYGKSDIEYAGFSDATFFEEENLKSVIGKVIEEVEITTNTSIKELTVGVPAEFCLNRTKKINATFVKKKKLDENLLNEVYMNTNEEIADYTLLALEPIYNILDDGKKIVSALNKKTTKISAFVSAIYVETSFIELFNKILGELGIIKVDYVCSAFAEGVYLLGEDKIQSNSMIIDIGYITSSIAIAKGSGLTNLFSFSMGGGHIMGDLVTCLNISPKEAENLKRRVVLSIIPSPSDIYELNDCGKVRKIFTKTANEIVCDRLDVIIQCIEKCKDLCVNDDEEISNYYLTGGGVAYMKGAIDYLSKKLGVNIELLTPPLAEFNKPHLSSSISLLAYSLKEKSKKPKGILAKLFNK